MGIWWNRWKMNKNSKLKIYSIIILNLTLILRIFQVENNKYINKSLN